MHNEFYRKKSTYLKCFKTLPNLPNDHLFSLWIHNKHYRTNIKFHGNVGYGSIKRTDDHALNDNILLYI